jgi:hypothetical protein
VFVDCDALEFAKMGIVVFGATDRPQRIPRQSGTAGRRIGVETC